MVKSPLIGKAVGHFYRKAAPPQKTRVWTMAGKVYYKIKEHLQGSDYDDIVKAM